MYDDLISQLRYEIGLRAFLEDEFGEDRAADICGAIARDDERQREEKCHPEATAIGHSLIDAIKQAFYENEDEPASNEKELGRLIADSITKSLAKFAKDGDTD